MHKKIFISAAIASLMLPALVGAQMPNEEVRAEQALEANAITPEDRLERAKERAEAEITRRMNGLNRVVERISDMNRVSDSFKVTLRSTVDTQIRSIASLRDRIAMATDPTALKEEIISINRSYRVFALIMPQASIAASADRIVVMTAMMTEIGTKLASRIGEAEGGGADTGELEAQLQSLSDHIDVANGYAKAALDRTVDLKADQGDQAVAASNLAALQTAREELRSAHEEVRAGRENIRAIIDGLKALNADTIEEEPAPEQE